MPTWIIATLGFCCLAALALLTFSLCQASGQASRAEEAREQEEEARRIEEALNPAIDKLGEEMGQELPHIKIEWED